MKQYKYLVVMAYTRDQGIEQLYRDNRITPIYEGTNSVQAIDLVFRKVLTNRTLEKFISLLQNEIKIIMIMLN